MTRFAHLSDAHFSALILGATILVIVGVAAVLLIRNLASYD